MSLAAGKSCCTSVAGPLIWFGLPASRAKSVIGGVNCKKGQTSGNLCCLCGASTTLPIGSGAKRGGHLFPSSKARSQLSQQVNEVQFRFNDVRVQTQCRRHDCNEKKTPPNRLCDRSATLLHHCSNVCVSFELIQCPAKFKSHLRGTSYHGVTEVHSPLNTLELQTLKTLLQLNINVQHSFTASHVQLPPLAAAWCCSHCTCANGIWQGQ